MEGFQHSRRPLWQQARIGPPGQPASLSREIREGMLRQPGQDSRSLASGVRLGLRTTSAGKREVQRLSQHLVLLVCSLCVLGFHLYFSHLVSTEQLGWLFSPFFWWGDWVSEIFGWSVQSHTARRCGAGIGMIWTQAESGQTERMGPRLTEGPMGGDFCSPQGLGMILFNQDYPPSLFELM